MSANRSIVNYMKAMMRLKYYGRTRSLLNDEISTKDPLDLFRYWLQDARNLDETLLQNVPFCLATVTRNGLPSNRFMNLRGINSNGFVFFTNYGSRKAENITSNPNVAMSLHWSPLQRSVRVEGVAEKIAHEDSLSFFHQRPRGTQIATLASDQSSKIASRSFLDKYEAGIKATLGPRATVPMPNWGGYLIRPRTMEFWQGRDVLMPDRIRFRRAADVKENIDGNLVHKGANGWVYERLEP